MSSMHRRFVLVRSEDVSGSSGTGRVADGIEFRDGTAVIRWNTDKSSTAVYESVEDVEAIHGHGGATKIEWVDGPFAVKQGAWDLSPVPAQKAAQRPER